MINLRKEWSRLVRPETRLRVQVVAINANGTSKVKTSDNRIMTVRNRPGLTIPVESFCVVSIAREPGEMPTILRSAPALPAPARFLV